MNPRAFAYEATALRLSYTGLVDAEGVKPSLPGCKPSVFSLDDTPEVGEAGGNETSPAEVLDWQPTGRIARRGGGVN